MLTHEIDEPLVEDIPDVCLYQTLLAHAHQPSRRAGVQVIRAALRLLLQSSLAVLQIVGNIRLRPVLVPFFTVKFLARLDEDGFKRLAVRAQRAQRAQHALGERSINLLTHPLALDEIEQSADDFPLHALRRIL